MYIHTLVVLVDFLFAIIYRLKLQEKDSWMKFVTLTVITASEYEDTIKKVAKDASADGATIVQARGGGSGHKQSFFALTFEGNQTIMHYILEEKLSKNVLKAINNEIQTNGTNCVAFTTPIGHIVGLDRELLKRFEDSIKQENDL